MPLDRTASMPLVEQLRSRIAEAIAEGSLAAGARLPSWRDLSSQLGVALGTVRQAYDQLVDAELVTTAGAKGTRVADRPVHRGAIRPATTRTQAGFPYFAVEPLPFQMGVPSASDFPGALWTRVARQAVTEVFADSAHYPDPCGELALRQEIAKHLALARGLVTDPARILVTSGYGAGLGLILQTLDLRGATGWVEDPGYPVAREQLVIAGIQPVPVPVDSNGLNVERATANAPGARIAIVTPGQQAPLGATLSQLRRRALLSWAKKNEAWVVEDDYLGELQIIGRAAPALTALDLDGRTLYIGTFSKAVSPMLRLGFIVVPSSLLATTTRLMALCIPAPSPLVQRAMARFIRDGHYLRHLRRMKSLYVENANALHACIFGRRNAGAMAGLAVLLRLPAGSDDQAICARAGLAGYAPSALSRWYANPAHAKQGLLLGVTNVNAPHAEVAWQAIKRLME